MRHRILIKSVHGETLSQIGIGCQGSDRKHKELIMTDIRSHAILYFMREK